MTIVVGLRCAGQTVIGWNDGVQINDTPVLSNETPWTFFGDWALGITGESSLQAIVAHAVKVQPTVDDASELIEYLRGLFIANYAGSKEADEFVTTFGIYSILAHRDGRMWDVSGCLSLTEIPVDKLWARGSGASFAIGADYAAMQLNPTLPPDDRVRIAVAAAIENDLYCVGKPSILTL